MNNQNENKTDSSRADALRALIEFSKSGYAGVDSKGQIVDRREHPEAVPIQKNSIFGTPEPKKV